MNYGIECKMISIYFMGNAAYVAADERFDQLSYSRDQLVGHIIIFMGINPVVQSNSSRTSSGREIGNFILAEGGCHVAKNGFLINPQYVFLIFI